MSRKLMKPKSASPKRGVITRTTGRGSTLSVRLHGKNLVSFNVPGQPVPAERVRRGRGGRFYTPGRTMEYRKAVAEAAYKVMGAQEPTKSPVALVSNFVRSGRRDCDVDNLQKSIQDALIGIGYVNDTQVAVVIALKGEGATGSEKAHIYCMELESVEITEEAKGDS